MGVDVRLRSGQRLTGTGAVLCARDGRLLDVDVRALVPGDWVGLSYSADTFPDEQVALADFDLSPAYGSQKTVRIPRSMDEHLALLLGMYASEGHTTRTTWTVGITNSVPSVLETCVGLWERCFGVAARVSRQSGRCPSVLAASKSVVEVMRDLGCGSRASDKRIPWAVMDSPRPTVIAFLRGLWLDAYTSTSGMARWALCVDSPQLLDDVQVLLRRLGLVTGRVSKYNREYDKTFDEVYACGTAAQELVRLVPFLEPDKHFAARRLMDRQIDVRRNGADVVPLVHGSALYAEIPKGRHGRNGAGSGVALKWRSLCDKRTVWPSRYIVQRIAEAGYRLPLDLQRVLDEEIHFSPVINVADRRPGATGRSA